ncbi:NADH dehydrogenase [ubiquinone] 1 beta subcomplex subunit 3-b [Phtheirospermum japonicum]|uniref:NADH dehydrogenase [ubiquinone] 1 beta subcomplex subunit 3-b n=1 Tax=Phtheirospermum japonicum TaxID=374723 RepID=A0A830D8S7_9LAMI|nr:NADH dehydrogenase [ubiquinone] 1 beta subcomplex subunit 3-b [Phtheirospermum japonicum]
MMTKPVAPRHPRPRHRHCRLQHLSRRRGRLQQDLCCPKISLSLHLVCLALRANGV